MTLLKRTAQIAAALALLTACAPVRAEIPLTLDLLGYVTVKALVDGQGPFDFVFDTGAARAGP